MVRYDREENGVRISLEIDNEDYSSKDIVEIIEKINTTVEVKEIKPQPKPTYYGADNE